MTKPLKTKALSYNSTTYGIISNRNDIPLHNLYYLPQSIINSVEKLNFKPAQKDRVFQLIVQLFTLPRKNESSGYYNISSKRLRNILGRKYKSTLDKLISADIIKPNNKYSTDRFTKSYKLVLPPLENTELVFTSTIHRSPTPYNTNETTKTIIKNLQVDINLAIQWIERYIEEFPSEIIPDPPIPQVIRVFTSNSRTPVYRRGSVAKSRKKQGIPIYRHGDRYIFGDIDRYIRFYKKYLKLTHVNTLLCIHNKHKNIYANRNNTNNRLDTNITTLKSELLHFMTLDKEKLHNIDLCNSQFTIFAALLTALENSSGKLYQLLQALEYQLPSPSFLRDIENRFITECRDCNLYEFVGESLSLDRKAAKAACFEIFFSNPKYTTVSKELIAKLFPNIVKWINEFKRLNGYKAFPIMLQRIESQIFIDNILKELLSKRFRVLTKHDSILCKESDILQVQKIVSKHLDKWLGPRCYEIKVEAT